MTTQNIKSKISLGTMILKDGRRFYYLLGNTFELKETIKQLGFSWDVGSKFWYIELPAGEAKDCSEEVRAHFAKIGKFTKDYDVYINPIIQTHMLISKK